MIRLNDPMLPAEPPSEGIQLPPLRKPESLDMPQSYVATSGAHVMTSKDLADARSAAVPPAPLFDVFGERVSHMTDRFVLSGSGESYRIWKFQSNDPAIEFPATDAGWALAWDTFRSLQSSTV